MKKRKKIFLLLLVFAFAIPACAAARNDNAPSALVSAAANTEAPELPFADLPKNADYLDAVTWCLERGLMNGTSDTAFSPDATLTRAMVVTVLYRWAGQPSLDNENLGYPFADVDASAWYGMAVYWARLNGVVQGYGDDRFGTEDPITQEQLDIILRRYNGENPVWTGDPARNVPATRAEAAVAFYNALKEDEANEPAREGKILIAYFSATNHTKGIANHIKTTLGDAADLYEIVPEVPYTSADLNYNSDCRANREQNDDSARPAISGNVENMEQYDVVFLGYPIWWGQAPKIIYTFLESNDLSGKTIVPFCTSGSSGIGSSAANLQGLTENATWLNGQRFSGGASESAVKNWVNGLGLELDPAA